jgi:hypothetical protein
LRPVVRSGVTRHMPPDVGTPAAACNNYNTHAYAGQLNSVTHLRALVVLTTHDRRVWSC